MLGLAGFFPVSAQVPASTAALRAEFARIAAYSGSSARTDSLTALINRLKAAGKIPFGAGDSALFIYRGNVTGAQVNGDHNSWGSVSANEVPRTAIKWNNLDLFILGLKLPPNARTDYKWVLNGSSWVLDPLNPRQQWGGFGPNSTFWMPEYTVETETEPRSGIPKGTLSANIRINSTQLGYAVNYRVYTPPGYTSLADLPSVYFTDGHEYADANLGAAPIVMDNGVANGEFPPIIAVFIDPRNPDNLNQNRRQSELVKNTQFSDFVALELIPAVDAAYKTAKSPEKRAIAGTSLGGFHSAWFAARHAEHVKNALIHSPAFWVDLSVFDGWNGSQRLPVRVFLSYGTLYDGTDNARNFRDILSSKGYDFRAVERSEGHSWGQWRTLINEPLHFFFGEPATYAYEETIPAGFTVTAFPNPFNPSVTIQIQSSSAAYLRWSVTDLTGKMVHTGIIQNMVPGATLIKPDFSGLASGVYLFKAEQSGRTVQRKLTLIR